MIKQFEVTLTAPSGNQTRTAYVHLPQTYDEKKRFPVLYMFDGQTAFFDDTAPYGDSWRMGEILDKFEAEIIVAAVEADSPNTVRPRARARHIWIGLSVRSSR